MMSADRETMVVDHQEWRDGGREAYAELCDIRRVVLLKKSFHLHVSHGSVKAHIDRGISHRIYIPRHKCVQRSRSRAQGPIRRP